MREGFAELAEALGDRIDEVELPEPFARAHDWHRTIISPTSRATMRATTTAIPSLLSDRLRGMIEEGLAVRAVDYIRALDGMAVLNAGLEKLFERYDAIVTPAAPGEAPVGLEATGDPAFCTLWTYCGVPALTLPLLTGPNGMPVGVQLVGRRHYDGRLLRTARWLSRGAAARSRARRNGDGSGGMTLLDRIFAPLALLAFAGYLGILICLRAEAGPRRGLRRLRRCSAPTILRAARSSAAGGSAGPDPPAAEECDPPAHGPASALRGDFCLRR